MARANTSPVLRLVFGSHILITMPSRQPLATEQVGSTVWLPDVWLKYAGDPAVVSSAAVNAPAIRAPAVAAVRNMSTGTAGAGGEGASVRGGALSRARACLRVGARACAGVCESVVGACARVRFFRYLHPSTGCS